MPIINKTDIERIKSLIDYTFDSVRSDGWANTTQKIYRRVKKYLKISELGTKDNTTTWFNPYERIQLLKRIKISVIEQNYLATQSMQFSCVTTVKNEEDSIAAFLESIASQTLHPSEVIIIDGGSTDSTLRQIGELKATLPFPTKVIAAGNVNIARGRNIGIGMSQHDTVLLVDAGCIFDKKCFCNLIAPFSDEDVDLVAGIHVPQKGIHSNRFVYDWSNFNRWSQHLPSARALVIKKNIWEKCGKFPEYLTKTGEDTWFNVQYRRYSEHWIFNKNALVYWNFPTSFSQVSLLDFQYGKGDGESGYGDFRFYHEYTGRTTCSNENFRGYLEGRRERFRIELLRRQIKGVVVLLSGIPFTDSGGGQRATQIALEYINRNYKVFFINLYPSDENNPSVFVDIDYSLIEFFHIADFHTSLVEIYQEKADLPFLFFIEFPHADFLPILTEAKSKLSNISIIYDYIDNWNSSLGGTWYKKSVEANIISKSDLLISSATNLQKELSSRVDKPVHLIPNAVNLNLFNSKRVYKIPVDFPTGKSIIYIGAMWGSWFDWELLSLVAQKFSDINIVLIGGANKNQQLKISSKFNNVHFLGLKDQYDLVAYLTHADIAIIPFKADNVTKYVNPLKVYEYIAMGKHVVSTTNIPEISSDLIHYSDNHESYLETIESVLGYEPTTRTLALTEESWESRVDRIMELIRN